MSDSAALLLAALVTAPAAGAPSIDHALTPFAELVAWPGAEEGGRALAPGLGLDGTVNARASAWLDLRLSPRFRWDPGDTRRSRWIPTEAWARLVAGPADATVGLQRFEWGNATLFRPTDVLNQRDYATGLFRAERLGDPAVAAAVHLGPTSVEAAWLPLYQHPALPATNAGLGFDLAGFDRVRLDLPSGFLTDDVGPDTMTFAARATLRLPEVEAELMWMRGPSRLPGPLLDDLTLRSVVYPVDVVGGAAAWVTDPVVVRAEGAWYGTGRAPALRVEENPQPWTEPIPDSYAAYVVGAERTLWDLVGDHDVTLVGEYLGEVRDHRDAQAALRPWQNDAFVAVRYALDDLDDTWLSAGVAVDLSWYDVLVRASASRHLGWDVTVALDAVVIVAGREGPLSLLHNLADRDSIRLTLRWAV